MGILENMDVYSRFELIVLVPVYTVLLVYNVFIANPVNTIAVAGIASMLVGIVISISNTRRKRGIFILASLLLVIFGAAVMISGFVLFSPPTPGDIPDVNCVSIGGIDTGGVYACNYNGNETLIVAKNWTDAEAATVSGMGLAVPKTYG